MRWFSGQEFIFDIRSTKYTFYASPFSNEWSHENWKYPNNNNSNNNNSSFICQVISDTEHETDQVFKQCLLLHTQAKL